MPTARGRIAQRVPPVRPSAAQTVAGQSERNRTRIEPMASVFRQIAIVPIGKPFVVRARIRATSKMLLAQIAHLFFRELEIRLEAQVFRSAVFHEHVQRRARRVLGYGQSRARRRKRGRFCQRSRRAPHVLESDLRLRSVDVACGTLPVPPSISFSTSISVNIAEALTCGSFAPKRQSLHESPRKALFDSLRKITGLPTSNRAANYLERQIEQEAILIALWIKMWKHALYLPQTIRNAASL